MATPSGGQRFPWHECIGLPVPVLHGIGAINVGAHHGGFCCHLTFPPATAHSVVGGAVASHCFVEQAVCT